MSKITRLELDVLKPNNLAIVDMARSLAEVKGVNEVDIFVKEIEKEVEKVRVTIFGKNFNNEAILKSIESLGCAVHNVDRVVVGR